MNNKRESEFYQSEHTTLSYIFVRIRIFLYISGSSNFGKMWEIGTSGVHSMVVP